MTKYRFDVEDDAGAVIILELDDGIVIDDWKTLNPPTKLVVEAGGVDDSQPGKLLCKKNNQVIIELVEASWSSEVDDSGEAICEGCESGCSSVQTWVLKSKS